MEKIMFLMMFSVLCLPLTAALIDDSFNNGNPFLGDSGEVLAEVSDRPDLSIISESGGQVTLTSPLNGTDGDSDVTTLVFDPNNPSQPGFSVTYVLNQASFIDNWCDECVWTIDGVQVIGHALMIVAEPNEGAPVNTACSASGAAVEVRIAEVALGFGHDYQVVVALSTGPDANVISSVDYLDSWDGNSDVTITIKIDPTGDYFWVTVSDGTTNIANEGTFAGSGALAFDSPSLIGFGVQPIGENEGTARYSSVFAEVYIPAIPDSFEVYDDELLSQHWTVTNGTGSIESSEVYHEEQSLKAVFNAAGTLTKLFGDPLDSQFTRRHSLGMWVKGDAVDVTLKALDDTNSVISTGDTVTVSASEWQWVGAPVYSMSPQGVRVEVSESGTVYFDLLNLYLMSAPEANNVLTWNLDETSGTTAHDSSGNGFNGTLYDAPTGIWDFIDGYNALNFNGVDPLSRVSATSIELPANLGDIFDKDESWSMNLWVYVETLPLSQDIVLAGFGDVFYSDGNGSARFLALRASGLMIVRGMNSPYFMQTQTTKIRSGVWQMLTATYDGVSEELRFYIDAQEVNLLIVDWPINARNEFAMLPRDYEYFNGYVSRFTVWDQPLSEAKIVELWGSDYSCLPSIVDESEHSVANFNGDCVVDIQDLAMFMESWMDDTRTFFE